MFLKQTNGKGPIICLV